ncbi:MULTISPECIES: hypothetical protein [unclassified Bradyrhizobium]|uniref:hypothetical protein n=1 Tax=Bradyrhizobium sp. USDA 4541 TaxID=2817704 RepID=UPI0020A43595|nr:hypothetical protein [Bradyrhizobium sp. USDA 4541]MCP1850219.1 hypothetical protein [Bradyrhizobium sp. USDA 4541]
MDSETFALLLVQKITLVGLIKFLDHKGILGKDLIIEFLEGVAANSDAATAELSPLVADSIEAMIASIRETQPRKPIVIPGGKQ